jgi:MFS family permease
MTGQLYTDQEAPPALRVTAQGMLTFVTYGLGMYIGSNLSGVAVDFFTSKNGDQVVRNWSGFWLSSAAMSFVILLLVAIFFQSKGRIESKPASLAQAAD